VVLWETIESSWVSISAMEAVIKFGIHLLDILVVGSRAQFDFSDNSWLRSFSTCGVGQNVFA